MPKVLREYQCQCGCGFKLQVEQEENGTYTIYVMERPDHGWGVGGLGWNAMRQRIEEYDDYYGFYVDDGELSHAVMLSRDDLDDLRILFDLGKRPLPTAP